MRNILASLLMLFGLGAHAQSQPKATSMDLATILYTTPTLSDDIAELEPLRGQPATIDLVFHEDEWTQVEFLPNTQLREVQRILRDYKAFEQANRAAHGWRKVYVRKIERRSVFAAAKPVQELARLLETTVSAAPVLTSAGNAAERVRSGFSLPIGRSVHLYGRSSADSIDVLGAHVGPKADDQALVRAFFKLNSKTGAILVDWRAQFVLVGASADGKLEVWRP